ncbi:hypothetical protein P175DRAFT_0528316 [Aspergillus ochraceoroseus IBT 24754]|uniref:Secreted protein n=1 Tax=Aspergillus ochraceoroseus IBT 24754 TaxID=1392256 RepID=A0A2T5M8F7_9EURO|nr:uncharacterized protein P175DRAFT_0528316 [Aspergillus ochraceoroseus IBT 24754]PTU24805.1 hypothetical protein P175DRAFT_0528316 [Aspergillus ochraceoroseus IBT 24754]
MTLSVLLSTTLAQLSIVQAIRSDTPRLPHQCRQTCRLVDLRTFLRAHFSWLLRIGLDLTFPPSFLVPRVLGATNLVMHRLLSITTITALRFKPLRNGARFQPHVPLPLSLIPRRGDAGHPFQAPVVGSTLTDNSVPLIVIPPTGGYRSISIAPTPTAVVAFA